MSTIVAAQLYKDQYAWFERTCKELGMSNSALIRKALDYYRKSEQVELQQLRRSVTMLDVTVGEVGKAYGWRALVERRIDALEKTT